MLTESTHKMNVYLGTICLMHSTWHEYLSQIGTTQILQTVNYSFSDCVKIFNTNEKVPY